MQSQAQLTWSDKIPIANGNEFGNMRPRVVMIDDRPAFFWMESPNKLWFSKSLSDSTFSEPIQLAANGHDIFVSGYGGADIATDGHNVFLVYMTKPFEQAKLYFRKSSDGGETWGPSSNFSANHIIPFLPTVSMSNEGNPTLMFMGYDTNYANPAYYTFTSINGGNSFGPPVKVSAGAPHEVCDCCPAHLSLEGNVSVALFRNNDQNVRDLWAATSFDNGASIDTAQDIDVNNWLISSCPSSGPDAILNNGVLHTVWMSAGSGSSKVYTAKMNVETQSWTSKEIYVSGGSQNYPRIAGNSDTVGIVFQNNENGINNSLFTYSIDGGVNYSPVFDLFGDSMSIQSLPDVAFSQNAFHFVFKDLFSSDVYYRFARFDAPSSISEREKEGKLYPNPAIERIYLKMDRIGRSVDVYNLMGQKIELNVSNNSINVSMLKSGIYIIALPINGDISYHKFLKQ